MTRRTPTGADRDPGARDVRKMTDEELADAYCRLQRKADADSFAAWRAVIEEQGRRRERQKT